MSRIERTLERFIRVCLVCLTENTKLVPASAFGSAGVSCIGDAFCVEIPGCPKTGAPGMTCKSSSQLSITLHIDHLFHSEGFECVKIERGEGRGSGHKPVIAEFKVKNSLQE